jgi:diaminopimelate epimerase
MEFYKYNATGNDFIIIDNRNGLVDMDDKELWQGLCTRRLSVGADGVIFLLNSDNADFRMKYLNADGGEVAMCGNGARAIAHFFSILSSSTLERVSFNTLNGDYSAEIDQDFVWVDMVENYDEQKIDVASFLRAQDSYYINTGVPHAIYQLDQIDEFNVYVEGKRIRNQKVFTEGVNVNFLAKSEEGYKIRTYERGVEDETLSCGTGITACAHYLWNTKKETSNEIKFEAPGGELKVKKDGGKVLYGGTVEQIYKGMLKL